jgi:hypothetical protein
VSKDLAEAVDWALPSIMRVFTQSGSIAEFDPIGPEDEQLAQQESDYTNQVIMRDNDGFMVLHDAIKDTLLLKNGYAKHFWEETEKVEEVPYSGLTLDQIAQMLGALEREGAKVEITEQESTSELIDTPQGPMPVELFNLTLKVTRKSGKVTVLAVPTEEIRVSKRCRGSLQESPFTEHVTRKTRSELIEMGMPRDFVDDLPALNETDNDLQTYSRDSVSDESKSTGANIIDRSDRVLRVTCSVNGLSCSDPRHRFETRISSVGTASTVTLPDLRVTLSVRLNSSTGIGPCGVSISSDVDSCSVISTFAPSRSKAPSICAI